MMMKFALCTAALLPLASACTGQLLTNADFANALDDWNTVYEGSGSVSGAVATGASGVTVTIPAETTSFPILYQDVTVTGAGDVTLTFTAQATFEYTTNFHYVSLKRVDSGATGACASNQQNYFHEATMCGNDLCTSTSAQAGSYPLRCSDGAGTYRVQIFTTDPGTFEVKDLCLQPTSSLSAADQTATCANPASAGSGSSCTGVEKVAEAMGAYYPYFADKGVADNAAWDAMLTSQIISDGNAAEAATDRTAFTAALKPLLEPLDDYHIYWMRTSTGAFVSQPNADAAWLSNFDSSWFTSAFSSGGDLTYISQSSTTYSGSPWWTLGSHASSTTGLTYGYLVLVSFAFSQSVWDELVSTALPQLIRFDGIILDLRANTGGNDVWASRLASLFAGASISGYSKVSFRAGPLVAQMSAHVDRQTPDPSVIDGELGEQCTYTAPVAVLVGRTCMSACDTFAAISNQVSTMRLIGDQTRGSSGNPSALEISGLDLSLYFSRWKDVLPDGTVIEGNGVTPDTLVSPPGGTAPTSFNAPSLSEADATTWAANTFATGLAHLDATADGTGNCPAVVPCFPSSATVTKADGTPSRIDTLKEGDEIVAATHDGTLTTDTVSLLSIAKHEVKGGAYVAIATAANKTVTLTPAHHVPVGAECCSTLKKAKDVEVGDVMWVVKDGKAVATAVTAKTASVKASGLHSPVLTNGGFPIVDGLVTSFDSIDKVTLAKNGLAPLLKACKATGTCETFRSMFLSADDRAFV
jgi:hypothetical protein